MSAKPSGKLFVCFFVRSGVWADQVGRATLMMKAGHVLLKITLTSENHPT